MADRTILIVIWDSAPCSVLFEERIPKPAVAHALSWYTLSHDNLFSLMAWTAADLGT